jgi:tRNA-Thr(GGU) m(6)t(6)A37 methyltransferase TsaA
MADLPIQDHTSRAGFPAAIPLVPIGVVRSPYTERHGTPRQPTVTAGVRGEGPASGRLVLFPDVVPAEALKDLDGFDRVWVIAWLHLNEAWRPTVVPPRGPRVRRGVLATRAPHRPNHLSLSALELVAVEGHEVVVRGLDLLDGTPILDIKPYVPYADAFPDAAAGWVDALGEPADAPDRPSRPRRLGRYRGGSPERDPTSR